MFAYFIVLYCYDEFKLQRNLNQSAFEPIETLNTEYVCEYGYRLEKESNEINIKHEIASSEQFTGMNETQVTILLLKKKEELIAFG